jgi:hypothetical protein
MRRSTLKVMPTLAGSAVVLTACAADPGYDSSQFAHGYPAWDDPPYGCPGYGYFDYGHFDYDWAGDWHHRWTTTTARRPSLTPASTTDRRSISPEMAQKQLGAYPSAALGTAERNWLGWPPRAP